MSTEGLKVNRYEICLLASYIEGVERNSVGQEEWGRTGQLQIWDWVIYACRVTKVSHVGPGLLAIVGLAQPICQLNVVPMLFPHLRNSIHPSTGSYCDFWASTYMFDF